MSKRQIVRLRKRIDRIDDSLVRLLNERAQLALKIARLKTSQRQDSYTPSRERAILDRLARKSRGPFPSQALQAVYREILSASRSLQSPLTVAYLGPEATFTHMAALKHFGRSSVLVPSISIARVFEEVEQGRAQFGVVAIENSTEGVVGATLDCFSDSPLKIAGEIALSISHHLLNRSGSLRTIRRVYSHPQAVGQCRSWLEENLPHIPIVEAESTARAAAKAADDPQAAAIASEEAGQVYRLKFVRRHIEDNANNITRFLILGKKSPGRTRRDKTSILFLVKDEVGILHRMLEPFARTRINLTKIESRPQRKKPWEYIFFIDMEGHIEEKGVAAAIRALEKHCLLLKVLGSYPKATP